MMETSVKKAVDRLTEIKLEKQALADEERVLMAQLQTEAEERWADKKTKTVYFKGTNGSVSVTRSISAKLSEDVDKEQLEKLFGKMTGKMVTEKTEFKLSAEAKRIVSALVTGEYCVSECPTLPIDLLDIPESAKNALSKKVNGKKFDTDLKNIIAFGVSEQEASDTAYLLYEAFAFKDILDLLVNNDIEKSDYEISLKNLEKIAKQIAQVTSGCSVTVRTGD